MINTFKYHISCINGKISVIIEIENTFIFRLHRRPVQLVTFVPIGLSLPLYHRRQLLLIVEVSSVARPGQLTVRVQITVSVGQTGRQKELRQSRRPADDVTTATKGLQEPTYLIE